jgi:hypothetical protein
VGVEIKALLRRLGESMLHNLTLKQNPATQGTRRWVFSYVGEYFEYNFIMGSSLCHGRLRGRPALPGEAIRRGH